MDLLDFFDPIQYSDPITHFISRHVCFFSEANINFSINTYQIALVGIPDDENQFSFEVASAMRKELFRLTSLSNNLSLIDLGNIKPGKTLADTYRLLSDFWKYSTHNNVITVLIGGKSIFMNAGIAAHKSNNFPLNIISIDSLISDELFDNYAKETDTDKETLNKSINFINIGYQSYYVPQSTIDFIDDSYFESYRLGFVRSNMKEMEPVLRDANLVSFSLNAIKHADAPGAVMSSPNGLSGDEACQLSFFAGHSNRISSFGLFDLALENDIHDTTAKLSAQILWYFMEGIANRIIEEPDFKPQNFTKYLLQNNSSDQNLCFYKSNLTNRWWMEISYSAKNHQILLSCSENDYELACKQDIPDRWWRTYQRTNIF